MYEKTRAQSFPYPLTIFSLSFQHADQVGKLIQSALKLSRYKIKAIHHRCL